MKKKHLLILVLSIMSLFSLAQEIPDYIKNKAIAAFDFSKKGQYNKALNLFDELIIYSEEKNDTELTKIIKKQKINCYWGISERKAKNDIQEGLLQACTNGLRLCNEINEKYSLNSLMFSVWLAGYYYMDSDYEKSIYSIDYTKRLLSECRDRNIETEVVLNEIAGMIKKLEREIDRLTNPPQTYSLSLGDLYNLITPNNTKPTTSYFRKGENESINKDVNIKSQLQLIKDGYYKYGSYTSVRYKVICPNGYENHIYYNEQRKCWMKTSSVTCDYSSTKGQEGLKKSAKILCNNN